MISHPTFDTTPLASLQSAGWVHRTPACRVVFGAGRIATLGAELAALAIRRPLVLSACATWACRTRHCRPWPPA